MSAHLQAVPGGAASRRVCLHCRRQLRRAPVAPACRGCLRLFPRHLAGQNAARCARVRKRPRCLRDLGPHQHCETVHGSSCEKHKMLPHVCMSRNGRPESGHRWVLLISTFRFLIILLRTHPPHMVTCSSVAALPGAGRGGAAAAATAGAVPQSPQVVRGVELLAVVRRDADLGRRAGSVATQAAGGGITSCL